MKIAIDLNDVIRDYSNNFIKYYIEGYNHEFDLTDFSMWSNKMNEVFTFTSDKSYTNFVYNDFSFELFGKCGTCGRKTTVELNEWVDKTVKDLDVNDEVEFMFVSPMEYGNSIGNTYFFISKLGTKIREIFLPKNSSEIWDRCDVLITANPDLLLSKPDSSKKSVKISTEYNINVKADFEFKNFSQLSSDIDATKQIISK